MKILKTKYYPVKYDEQIIYDHPQAREGDCGLGSKFYHGFGTIGIIGSRLLKYADKYKNFKIIPACTELSPAYLVWRANDFRPITDVTQSACIKMLDVTITIPRPLFAKGQAVNTVERYPIGGSIQRCMFVANQMIIHEDGEIEMAGKAQSGGPYWLYAIGTVGGEIVRAENELEAS